jgi:hypothetical protein
MALMMKNGKLLAHYFGGRLALTEDPDVCDCDCGGGSDCCELLFTPDGRSYLVTIAGYSFPAGSGANGAYTISKQTSFDTGCLDAACEACVAIDGTSIIVRIIWDLTESRWVVIMTDEDASYSWCSSVMNCAIAAKNTVELSHCPSYGGGTPPGTGTVTIEPLGVI